MYDVCFVTYNFNCYVKLYDTNISIETNSLLKGCICIRCLRCTNIKCHSKCYVHINPFKLYVFKI